MRTEFRRNYYDNTWSNGDTNIAIHQSKIVATTPDSVITINTRSKSLFSERLDVTIAREGERIEIIEYDNGIFGKYLVSVCWGAVTYKPMNERTSEGMYEVIRKGSHGKVTADCDDVILEYEPDGFDSTVDILAVCLYLLKIHSRKRDVSAVHKAIPTFLSSTCNSGANVKLCEATIEIDLDYSILIGEDFVLLYFKEDGIVQRVWRVPKIIFTECTHAIQYLPFTAIPVESEGMRENIVFNRVKHMIVGALVTLTEACNAYSGDTQIVKLYESDEEAVFVYKEDYVYYDYYVVFEVINFKEQSNKNSCRIPWKVYKEIVDTLDRRLK